MLSTELFLNTSDLPPRARSMSDDEAAAMFGGFWRRIRRAARSVVRAPVQAVNSVKRNVNQAHGMAKNAISTNNITSDRLLRAAKGAPGQWVDGYARVFGFK